MKILHVAETIKGGVATVLRQLAIEQSKDDYISEIICIVPDSQVSELYPLENRNIKIFKRSGRNIKSFFSLALKMASNVYALKPDIVHLHSTFSGVIGRIVLFLMYPIRRPKVVYCPHAFSFLMQGDLKLKSFFSKIERMLLPMTDAIICVSNYERDKSIEQGFPSDKLHVVYNGVPAVSRERSVVSPLPKDKINLLFVGRFDFQKGFDIFERIMPSLDKLGCHLTAVGESVHSHEVSSKNLPGTTYTGWLTAEQLKPYFEHSDVLIIPSRWEGFAMVPLEAMSYGLPIISSNCTSFPEMIVEGVTGYMFDLAHPESIVDYLALNSKENWQRMGENGREVFLKKFTASNMIEKTRSIYSSLI
ncbi:MULTISPECIES: glycosyltransferase [Serratia]|uniref:glycosyltransferase n=1 Tax=Serratia TaxID=613 RepID=UPI000666CB8B|nr:MULTISPECIES: glycosyltransferase [Serratia]MBH3102541.1 glycosyltransferase [Serratia marcescens]MCW7608573.1 glycosyltransferase [Serratia bockelmannii]HAV5984685.1 glycosyltransferase family 4 protein [Serratia marcescens]